MSGSSGPEESVGEENGTGDKEWENIEVAEAQEEVELPTGSFFSTSRPKDAMEGAWKGVGNVCKGALGGVALILSAPIKGAYDGAKEGGSVGALKGFGAGMGVGLLGGAAMALGGAVTGVVQIGRGLYHTPGAITASALGKDWDEEKKEWVVFNLVEEERTGILTMTDEEFLKSLCGVDGEGVESGRSSREVADKEYYTVLNVPTNATSAEIKKAYYVMARKNHPDRHPDDPEAHSKFQKIGEAYQVLIDDSLRANYDASGKEGVEGAPKVDSGILFAMVFGSEKFEPLVGELIVASQINASQELGGMTMEHPKLKPFHQRKRVLQCAINLAKRLDGFALSVSNAVTEARDQHPDDRAALSQAIQRAEIAFREECAQEAAELASSAFGGALIAIIGDAYSEQARTEADSFDGTYVQFKKTGRRMSTTLSMAGSAAKVAFGTNEVMKMQQKGAADSAAGVGGDDSSSVSENQDDKTQKLAEQLMGQSDGAMDEGMKKKIKELGGHIISIMWCMTQLDIESTLTKVCRRVLRDHAVTVAERAQRVKGLLILGEEFIKKGVPPKDGIEELVSRMTDHMNGDKAGDEEQQQQQQQQGEGGEEVPSPDSTPAQPRTMEEAMGLSVKELREALRRAGVDTTGCSEKHELASLLVAIINPAKPVASKSPSSPASHPLAKANAPPPPPSTAVKEEADTGPDID